jgi:Domain of unknown function (DUF4082)
MAKQQYVLIDGAWEPTGGPPGAGANPEDLDSRFVNSNGDTMTEPLVVDNGTHITTYDAGGISAEDNSGTLIITADGGLLLRSDDISLQDSSTGLTAVLHQVGDPAVGTDAVNLQTLTAHILANPGPQGPVGPPGGAYLSAEWTFNQTLTPPPASGIVRLNQTTFSASTFMYISETDRDNLDRAAGLNVLKVGDQVMLQSPQGRAVWNVTSLVDSGTYRTIGISIVEFSGIRPSASQITTIYIVNTQVGKEIQDEGIAVPNRAKLNFVGSGVTVTDDAANSLTQVSIPGGGSVILSGTVTPSGAVGSAGDYYLETDASVLYGPKASNSFGAPASAIGATPAGNSVNNYANRSFGMRFQIMTNGRITKLRLHNPGGSMNGYSRLMHLWSDAGVLLAQASTTNETGPGWVEATLTTPVAVTAGTFYRVSYNMPLTTYFSYTIGAPVSVSSHFTTLAPYVADTLSTFPSSLTATDDRYADVVFEPDLGTPWPIALKSVPSNAGTILSGTAVPTGAVGSIGDYYLDTDDKILYGPKVALASDEYVTTSPLTTAVSTGGGAMCGMKYRFAVAGFVRGLRILPTVTSLTVPEVYLFTGAGTLVASKDNATPLTASVWNTILFDSPVAVSPGVTYVAALWGAPLNLASADGTYAGQTSGNVTALADGVDGQTSTYAATRDTCPLVDMGNAAQAISPIFSTSGDNQWPVALKSVPPGGTASQVLAKTSGTDYAADWVAGGSVVPGTILSGTATPIAGTGVLGDYYLDTDDRLLYGPKVPVPADEYVTLALDSDTHGMSVGQKFRFLISGLITGVRLFVPASAVLTGYEVYVWSTAGAMLTSKDAPTLTAGAWNTVGLTTPLAVSPGITYMVGVYCPVGSASIKTLGLKSSGPFVGATSGNVVALADGVDGQALQYNTGGRDSFPNTNWTGTMQYAGLSPVFNTGTQWPVALNGIWTGTQAQYDAIATKNPNVTYVVV